MAADYTGIQLACRSHALAATLLTTGSMSLAATGSTFVRTTGSFLTDGFLRGMEVTATGFSTANNAARVVTAVTALTLTVSSALSTQAASTGRTLVVVLPSTRAWENIDLDPTPGVPWVQEQMIPGPSVSPTLGPSGTLILEPIYTLAFHVPENTGLGAARYCDKIAQAFKPGTQLVLASGDVAEVRRDTGPFRGPALRVNPGWVTILVSFPLRLFTSNT